MTDKVARPTARVIVVGPGDRVLLFHFSRTRGDATGSFWLTPGGGIKAGESVAAAAARELAEETGIMVAPGDLGAVVTETRGEWTNGRVVYAAHDSFFFLRVADTAVSTDGQEELERALVRDHRWWALAELASSQEEVYPAGLAELVSTLIAGGPAG